MSGAHAVTDQKALDVLEPHMRAIEKCFKDPVKLTLLCRSHTDADRDLIMTCDDLDEVIRAIQRFNSDPNYPVPEAAACSA